MKPRCLTTIRMSMTATLLHANDNYDPYPDINPDKYGEWVKSQDPLTGDIVKVWEPFPDDPHTSDNEAAIYSNIPCIARGIVDGGIRVAGTTERFGDTYQNIDFVKMWIPASYKITKRDRITNIRDKSGHIRWLDEEFFDPNDTGLPRATVFNVNGVTPLFNAWNELSEWFVLLDRAEVNGPN